MRQIHFAQDNGGTNPKDVWRVDIWSSNKWPTANSHGVSKPGSFSLDDSAGKCRFKPGNTGVGKKESHKRALDFLEKIGLGKFVDAYPHTLSGGMRQRVAIARAFLADPEILLMDEPFGMLDSQTRLVMQEELLNFWQERQHTVVYVTHDIEEAIFLGDRILVMSGRPGRLLEDIKNRVATPAGAGYHRRQHDRYTPSHLEYACMMR